LYLTVRLSLRRPVQVLLINSSRAITYKDKYLCILVLSVLVCSVRGALCFYPTTILPFVKSAPKLINGFDLEFSEGYDERTARPKRALSERLAQ
jgi:hypothetical protein